MHVFRRSHHTFSANWSRLDFILEYAPYGSLDVLLRSKGSFCTCSTTLRQLWPEYALAEALARTIIQQMCAALVYLHEIKKMAHRDLKPQVRTLPKHR